MSVSEQKQLDLIFKGVFVLLGFALTIIFYSLWNNVSELTKITNSLDGRLIKIETKLDDELAARIKEDARRDQEIEQIKKIISAKK